MFVLRGTKAACSVLLLANHSLHEDRFTKRPVVLVRDRSIYIALEERKHGEPDASPAAVLIRPGVGQRMVVEEEASSDIESNKHIDGVVLVSREDEENPKQIQHPGNGVNEIPGSRSVFSDKKVEHCDDHGVSTEHVIPAGMDPGQSHAKPGPDRQGSLYLPPCITISLTGTLQMLPRHRQ